LGLRECGRLEYRQKRMKRKSVVPGLILLVLGMFGTIIAAIEYPIWSHNREVLHDNESWGMAQQSDYDLVEFQSMVMIGGFAVGIPMAFVGLYLLISAHQRNMLIDRAEVSRSQVFVPGYQAQPPPISSGQLTFCPNCGNRLTQATPHCPMCGKRLS